MDMHNPSIYQAKANQVATSGNDEAKVGCMARRWNNSPKSCVQEGIEFEHRQVIREQMVSGEYPKTDVTAASPSLDPFVVIVETLI